MIRFQATDIDEGENAHISYSIAARDSDNDILPFTVNADDGSLTATREFLINDKKQYVFSAQAMDNPADPNDVQTTTTPVYVSYIKSCVYLCLLMEVSLNNVLRCDCLFELH